MAIYLDHLSTTPIDPRVLEAMLPYFNQEFGNAASRTHGFGWRAREAVEEAREKTAALIGARPEEIVFTSGATEAINLALKGLLEAHHGPAHVISARGEHRSVLDTCHHLEERGARLDLLELDAQARVSPEELERTLTGETRLVCVQWANNEVGTIQPVEALVRKCRARGALFFTDASQAVGKIPVDLHAAGIDLACVSAHKLYGPKGTGALYVRKSEPRIRLAPQMEGGGHERGLRAGTLNVPGIVGLGRACEIAAEEMQAEGRRVAALRDRLQAGIRSALPDVIQNAGEEPTLAGCLNLSFPDIAAEDLMMELGDIALSSGSACTSARPEPSHVLGAMGLSDARARSSIRFGLGRFTSSEEIEETIQRVVAAVGRLAQLRRA